MIVFLDGLEHLSHNPGGAQLALGIFEVVAAVLVIGSVFHGVHQLRKRLATPHDEIAAWGDRKRQLLVTPEGIGIPGRFFRRTTLSWAEVESIEMDDRSAVIKAIDGRSKRIDLGDVLQPKLVRDVLTSARSLLAEARHAATASIESIPSDT